MTDISLIPILKSEGWKVMTRSKLKSMKKEELIETIETLENNYGATIERANNSYNYGKSEIERLEKEKCELLGIIQGKDKVIAELKKEIKNKDNCIDCESVNTIINLEKENAELKERIKDLLKPPLYDGYSLQKENAELKEALNERKEVIAELKAQIEKMKCCMNCKNGYDDEDVCCNCNNENCWKNWELANE